MISKRNVKEMMQQVFFGVVDFLSQGKLLLSILISSSNWKSVFPFFSLYHCQRTIQSISTRFNVYLFFVLNVHQIFVTGH